MKVGDLVRHAGDGAFGMCIDSDPELNVCRIVWFDCAPYQTPYTLDHLPDIEVVDENR